MKRYRQSDFEHPMRYKLIIPMFEGVGLVFRNGAPLIGAFILTTYMLVEEFIDFDKALDAHNTIEKEDHDE